MPVIFRRILWIIWAGALGFFIALVAQGVWTGLLIINLASGPAIPWSIGVMAVLLWLIWLYLGGRGWPRRTAQTRHRYLRANRVPSRVFGWAFLAGALSVTAQAGYWIVMARIVRMPGNVLPDMSAYPPLTVALALGMGSVISPLLEQAGFWGYCQVMLEDKFPAAAAILITSIIYAFGPHPPPGSPLWPRLIFYFLTGLTFSLTSYFTNSNLPGLLVHALGILAFFTLVWPNDPTRALIGTGGIDAAFWASAAVALVFTFLSALAFRKLAKITRH